MTVALIVLFAVGCVAGCAMVIMAAVIRIPPERAASPHESAPVTRTDARMDAESSARPRVT